MWTLKMWKINHLVTISHPFEAVHQLLALCVFKNQESLTSN